MYFNSSHLIKEESKAHHHTFLKVMRQQYSDYNKDKCKTLQRLIYRLFEQLYEKKSRFSEVTKLMQENEYIFSKVFELLPESVFVISEILQLVLKNELDLLQLRINTKISSN